MGHSLTVSGRLFHSLPPMTDRAACPKVVRLYGTIQSPLTTALVTLVEGWQSIRFMNSFNGESSSIMGLIYLIVSAVHMFTVG